MILKMKIYKHHIISLEIIAFTSLFLAICITIYYKYSTFQASIYHILTSFFFCLFDVLGKKYLNIFCDSPFQIMIKIGIMSITFLFIYDLIVFCIKGDRGLGISGIIIGIKNNFKLLNILFVIIDIILFFLGNAGIWITLYYLTPCHFILSESISEYIYYTKQAINCKDDKIKKNYSLFNLILYSTAYIINIIAALIFNEVIILNIKRLGEFTKKKILERERIDTYIASKKCKETINTLTSSKISNINEHNENDENDFPLSLINLDKINENNIEDNINE